jgi:peroxiredoxin Q/BCP
MMARKPAPKPKSSSKNNKKASKAAASTAKASKAGGSKAMAKASKTAVKTAAKSKAAKSPAKKLPAPKAKKAGKRGGVLKAAKKVLSSVATTAKDAVNLAVASTMARTASKAEKTAPKAKVIPASLAEGAMAPDFHLPRDGGGIASAADFAGKNLVLFFYPRADTPGCTREAMDFTRLGPQFDAANTAVLGVSADTVKDQDAFREKYCLGVPLVADETHDLIKAFGVWGEKSMYGKTFMGIVRTTVLIGKDRRVAKIWRSVSVDGHADEVLATAKAI